jgi:hypothetical protein
MRLLRKREIKYYLNPRPASILVLFFAYFEQRMWYQAGLFLRSVLQHISGFLPYYSSSCKQCKLVEATEPQTQDGFQEYGGSHLHSAAPIYCKMKSETLSSCLVLQDYLEVIVCPRWFRYLQWVVSFMHVWIRLLYNSLCAFGFTADDH